MTYQSKIIQLIVSSWFILLVTGGQSVAENNISFNELRQQAQAGDASSQYELAESYYRGDGAQKNAHEALAWYEKAANQGHVDAQYQIGYFYRYGLGNLEKNDKTAFEWFHKAATQGHMAAQTRLSIMYSQGIGVEEDKQLSRLWSDRVLKKKGIFTTSEEAPVKTKKKKVKSKTPVSAERKPRIEADKKTNEVEKQPSARVVPGAVEIDTDVVPDKSAAPQPERSPEQEKIWRHEQALRLVEEANKKAAEAGGWSDVE